MRGRNIFLRLAQVHTLKLLLHLLHTKLKGLISERLLLLLLRLRNHHVMVRL